MEINRFGFLKKKKENDIEIINILIIILIIKIVFNSCRVSFYTNTFYYHAYYYLHIFLILFPFLSENVQEREA